MSARRHPSARPRTALALVALVALGLALLLTVAACGGSGGGGGGGGGGPTPPPPPGVTFTPTGGATANVIVMRRTGGAGNTLVLEVRAEGVTDLYGVAFDLRYPSNLLRLDSRTEGELLSQNGVATTFQAAESGPGNLVVGISRLGGVSGVTGSGVLMTLQFTAVGAGSGTLSFVSNRAFDSGGLQVGGVQWLGGTLQVNL